MDGSATMSEIRQSFRTPVRILLPKILKSRDDGKAKSHERKAQLKSAKIKIRDLSASRDRWRERTARMEEEHRLMQERLALAEGELDRSRATVAQLEEAKKSRRHARFGSPARWPVRPVDHRSVDQTGSGGRLFAARCRRDLGAARAREAVRFRRAVL